MNNESLPTRLILASTSKYRQILLQRLGLPFDCRSPDMDETAGDRESPIDLVGRLASGKAKSVSRLYPQAVVIGSDQVAVFNDQIIGKPGNFQAAMDQLTSFSGQMVEFFTAVSIQSAESDFCQSYTDRTRVFFRTLQQKEIKRYLEKEKPFDCAGAFKAESLGITMFKCIASEDPTALIGLPLIRTADMLRQAGFCLP